MVCDVWACLLWSRSLIYSDLDIQIKGLFKLVAQRQFDGVKHDALVLEHMSVNRSIHTDRVTAQ